MPHRTLYALLIGVQSYEDRRIQDLDGTINDVEAWGEFLKKNYADEFHLEVKKLTTDMERKPTKLNVVEAFMDHFRQASPDDVIFFYFAGHGLREKTTVPALAKVQKDGKITGFVCYDSKVKAEADGEGSILADKELRYLLNAVAKPTGAHILVITDCCHSEGNTRTNKPELKTRRANLFAIEERPYEGFIFDHAIPESKMNGNVDLGTLMPIAPQISIAACRDVEEAHEARYPNGKIGGFLTVTLLEILEKAKGKITYRELKDRLVNRMRDAKRTPQTPRLFSHYSDPTAGNLTFLTLPTPEQTYNANVDFRGYKTWKDWTIDIGAVHGISTDLETHPLSFKVVNRNDGKDTFQAKAIDVHPELTRIRFLDQEPDKTGLYFAEIKNLATKPLRIAIKGVQSDNQTILKESLSKLNDLINFVEEDEDHDYAIFLNEKGQYLIVEGGDPLLRPLIRQIHISDQDVIDRLKKILNQMSKWVFLKKLYNPQTKLFNHPIVNSIFYPLEIEVIQILKNKEKRKIIIDGPEAEVELDQTRDSLKDNHRLKAGRIQFRIKNIHPSQKLYILGVYLSKTFGATSQLFFENGQFVEPNQVIETRPITFVYPFYLDHYDWDENRELLKIIFSTEEFSSNLFNLPSLQDPITPNRTQTKPIDSANIKNGPPKADWAVIDFNLFARKEKKYGLHSMIIKPNS